MSTNINNTQNIIKISNNSDSISITNNNTGNVVNISSVTTPSVSISSPGPKGNTGADAAILNIPASNIIGSFSNITASGNISASGTITAEHIHSTDDISVSQEGKILFDGPNGNDYISYNGSQIDIFRSSTQKLSIQDSKVAIGNGNLHVYSGDITASGHISASGDISAANLILKDGLSNSFGNIHVNTLAFVNGIYTNNTGSFTANPTNVFIGASSPGPSTINFATQDCPNTLVIHNSHVTASGDLTVFGTVIAPSAYITNITASGDISGGIIYGNVLDGGPNLTLISEGYTKLEGHGTNGGIILSDGSISRFVFDVGGTPGVDIAGDFYINPTGGNTIFTGSNVEVEGDISASGTMYAGNIELPPGGAIRPTVNNNTIRFAAQNHGSGDWMQIGSDRFQVYMDGRAVMDISAGGTITMNATNDDYDFVIKNDDSRTAFATDAANNFIRMGGPVVISNRRTPGLQTPLGSDFQPVTDIDSALQLSGSLYIDGDITASLHNGMIIENLPTTEPLITGSLWLSGSGHGSSSGSKYLMVFNG